MVPPLIHQRKGSAMTLSDLPLSKIFWNIFAIEAVLIGALLFKAVQSFSDSKPTDGGMMGP